MKLINIPMIGLLLLMFSVACSSATGQAVGSEDASSIDPEIEKLINERVNEIVSLKIAEIPVIVGPQGPRGNVGPAGVNEDVLYDVLYDLKNDLEIMLEDLRFRIDDLEYELENIDPTEIDSTNYSSLWDNVGDGLDDVYAALSRYSEIIETEDSYDDLDAYEIGNQFYCYDFWCPDWANVGDGLDEIFDRLDNIENYLHSH